MTKSVEQIEKDIREILKGIDKDSSESDDGWWETSAGVKFGSDKLKEVIDYIVKEKYKCTN